MFSFHGGMLWIDFINTQFLHQGSVQDQIHGWEEFANWRREAGLGELQELAPLEAERLLQHLTELRAELREMAEEIAATGAIPETCIEHLNKRLSGISGTWRLEAGAREAVFYPSGGVDEQADWPLLQSAMDFLVSQEVPRLKRCSNQDCIQYYCDTSKNNARRWCRMEVCGNRHKARRHYQKKKEGGGADE